MKVAFGLVIFLILAIPAMAEVPGGTYAIGELEKAQAEALERGKALAFLVSDPDSKYSKTKAATEQAIKELRRSAVVVFLDSKKDAEVVMPPPVVTSLRSPTIGVFDPRVVLLTADLVEVLEEIGSEKLVGDAARDTYRELRKALRGKLDAWRPGGLPPADELIWVRADGRHYNGRFVAVKAGRLHVQSEKFGEGSLPLGELSPCSQIFAKRLAAMVEKPKPGGEEHEVETWTSSEGGDLQASFVSLIDGKLTVETATGKAHTFPLKRLSQESQARAKDLAKGD